MELPAVLAEFRKDQLQPILEAAVGEPVVLVRVEEGLPVRGGATGAEKGLFRFQYQTASGTMKETTLFVKKCVWNGRPESVHYRHLAACGTPTPRLFGALCTEAGEEVIFVERVSRTGFRKDREEEWRRYLSLMARFNACPVSPDYAVHLYKFEQIGRPAPGLCISGLGSAPDFEELETVLRACGTPEEDLPARLQAAHVLTEQVAAQPRGLVHQDFLPDNAGWCGEEMVIFDLHKNAWGPRFADAAPYLGLPDWSEDASFLDETDVSGETRRDRLTRHYLEEYARHGGDDVSLPTCQEEMAALSRLHKVSVLGWLVEHRPERAREALELLQ